jgi:N-methylhydantoinase B
MKTVSRSRAKPKSAARPRRAGAKVDPITLSVVRAALETTQREMTLSLEKTARSSVFNLAHDYSTTLFDAKPEMILQGQDIPIHLGSLMPAMKAVARYFGDDIHEGDLILHNDPAYGGSHAIDTCMYKPVFYKGQHLYWTVCKGHLTDIGGPVPAGYNPNAKEIFAECLRIPPVKIWDKGKPRTDVLNMILTNMRARRDQEGDFNALIGACQVGERSLLKLLDRYGHRLVDDCITELLDMADRHMRSLIRSVPDGTYEGVAILEEAGHGFGDFEIKATVTIRKDTCHIAISSPPQIPYFINSYEGNSHSGVYLGLMMFARLPPPYNEGLYRCVTLDFGPKGTLCNAKEPAPHMNCTTTPMETLTDAVRLAFEKAVPAKVAASRQRPQHRRLGPAPRRGIRDDGAGHHHLRRRRNAGAGWLACLRPGMLLRRAHLRRRRTARIFLSDRHSPLFAHDRLRRRREIPGRIGNRVGSRTAQ